MEPKTLARRFERYEQKVARRLDGVIGATRNHCRGGFQEVWRCGISPIPRSFPQGLPLKKAAGGCVCRFYHTVAGHTSDGESCRPGRGALILAGGV